MTSDTPGDDWDPKRAFDKVSASLEQPDKFAEIFCNAAKKQTDIHNILKETFKGLLQHDHETRVQIKGLLKEIEKEDWTHFIKKIGFGGWTLISGSIGAIITLLARR